MIQDMNNNMQSDSTVRGAVMIPTLRYRDAVGAIDFLCRAFGFEKALVVEGEGGSIDHAQLTWNGSMLMLGSARDDEYGQLVGGSRPDSSNGMGLYIVVADARAHCAHAREAGAEIVMEPEEQHYGGFLYTCRDPEGTVWSFGEYDPWKDLSKNDSST